MAVFYRTLIHRCLVVVGNDVHIDEKTRCVVVSDVSERKEIKSVSQPVIDFFYGAASNDMRLN